MHLSDIKVVLLFKQRNYGKVILRKAKDREPLFWQWIITMIYLSAYHVLHLDEVPVANFVLQKQGFEIWLLIFRFKYEIQKHVN